MSKYEMTHDESSGQRMIPWADSFYIFLCHSLPSAFYYTLLYFLKFQRPWYQSVRKADGGSSSTIRNRPADDVRF